MKRTLLIILFGLFYQNLNAQIIKEHKYFPNPASLSKLSTGATIYTALNISGNQVKVYDANHALIKTFNVPNIPAYNLMNAYFVTDKTFNLDTNFEYVASYLPATGGLPTLRIYNESGSPLFAIDSCAYVAIYNTSTGTKMVATKYQTISTQYNVVYSLPGSYSPLGIKPSNPFELETAPYPNPAGKRIALPYNLSSGQTGIIRIFTLSGKEINNFVVDNTYKELLFDTGDLAKGTYFYMLESSGSVSNKEKFIVQ